MSQDLPNELELAYELELETHNKVIEMVARAKTPTEIERATGIPPRMQREIYKKFEQYANSDFNTQRRMKAIVGELDVQYTFLLRRLDKLLDEAEMNDQPKEQREIVKEMANINKMRADQLQKAGLLSSEGIAEDLVRWENEKQAILGVLGRLVQKFPEAGKWVALELENELGGN